MILGEVLLVVSHWEHPRYAKEEKNLVVGVREVCEIVKKICGESEKLGRGKQNDENT